MGQPNCIDHGMIAQTCILANWDKYQYGDAKCYCLNRYGWHTLFIYDAIYPN